MPTSRFPYLLVAGATAIVIGSGFTFAGLHRHADSRTTSSAPLAPAPRADLPLSAPAVPPAPTADPSVSAKPTASVTPTIRPKPTTRRTSKPTSRPARKPVTVNLPPTGDKVLDAVLAHINQERAAEGKGALTLDPDLSKASERHNEAMLSNGCGLNHRCSGEADLGPRFAAQGVRFRTAGENIGFRSGGSSSADLIEAANRITDSMLAETPPEDGHRKNLLNGDFTTIGLAVSRDDGLVWLTQDFVG